MLDDSRVDYEVYVNLISSPAGRYLSRHPYLIAMIKQLLANKPLKGHRVVIEADMGRDIGTTDVISTSEKDTIYYAQPLKSDVFSRFARNRKPQLSTALTVIADQDADGNYEVSDTWIGANRPAFPGDDHETTESKIFWLDHALVHDAVAIQSKTVTKTCPY